MIKDSPYHGHNTKLPWHLVKRFPLFGGLDCIEIIVWARNLVLIKDN